MGWESIVDKRRIFQAKEDPKARENVRLILRPESHSLSLECNAAGEKLRCGVCVCDEC